MVISCDCFFQLKHDGSPPEMLLLSHIFSTRAIQKLRNAIGGGVVHGIMLGDKGDLKTAKIGLHNLQTA